MAGQGHSNGSTGSLPPAGSADRPDYSLQLPNMSPLPGINSAARLFQVQPATLRLVVS